MDSRILRETVFKACHKTQFDGFLTVELHFGLLRYFPIGKILINGKRRRKPNFPKSSIFSC